MLVYITAFVLTLLFVFLYTRVKKRCYKVCLFILSMLPFWFVSAFRYDVGTDYFNTYVKYFEHTKIGWHPYKTEPLFQLLNYILVKFNCDVIWLFIITSFIFIFFVFLTIFKYSKNYYLSIIIFFVSSIYFNSLNNVRQYLALAIAFYGISNPKMFKRIIFLIIATLIHLSSCLLFVIIILEYFSLNKRKFSVINILMIFIAPFACIIIFYIFKTTKYGYFFDTTGTGFSLALVIVIFLYTFLTWYFYDENNISNDLAYMQIFTFLSVLCSIILQNEEMWMRIIRVFSFSHIILVPCVIQKCKNSFQKKYISFALIFSYAIYTFYTVYLMDGLNVFPYKFIFNI